MYTIQITKTHINIGSALPRWHNLSIQVRLSNFFFFFFFSFFPFFWGGGGGLN